MNDDQTIVVRCPPQRLRWLAAELRSAGIPFDVERSAGKDYHVTTQRAAAPTLHKVLDTGTRRPPPWKGLHGIGRLFAFGVLLIAIAWVVVQVFGGMIAAGLGVNMSIVRAIVIAVGATVAMLAVVVWGGRPPGGMPDDRGGFLLALLGLVLAGAAGVALVGMGVIR